MPFIKYKGEPIYFDTLEEAQRAIDALSGQRSPSAANGTVDGPWTLSRFKDYVGRLTVQQSKMLQELVKSPHGRTAKDLAPALGFSSAKAFGPVLAAMSKHAKKAGIPFDAVLKSDRVDVGDDRMLVFNATPAFTRIAVEAGWKAGD